MRIVFSTLILSLGTATLAPGAAPVISTATAKSKPITAPLRVSTENPNYFTDGSGRAVYLTGSHTWNDFQDWGTDDSPQPFDFAAYVNMLVAHHHNLTLLWQTELPVFHGLPTHANASPDFFVTPQPWQRTGPGNASDGKSKFDLAKFNQAYFDRFRTRVQQLNAAGIYAGVYLFSGEWLLRFRFPGDGYPLTGANNVNGIDDGGGVGSVTMSAPNAITGIQDAFVRKLIDTLNDLPNVLWIVSQEAPPGSEWWNNHLISLTRAYEAGKPLQHPIGFGVLADNNDATILNSDADWIAPAARISPTRSCGSGHDNANATPAALEPLLTTYLLDAISPTRCRCLCRDMDLPAAGDLLGSRLSITTSIRSSSRANHVTARPALVAVFWRSDRHGATPLRFGTIAPWSEGASRAGFVRGGIRVGWPTLGAARADTVVGYLHAALLGLLAAAQRLTSPRSRAGSSDPRPVRNTISLAATTALATDWRAMASAAPGDRHHDDAA